MAERLGDSRSKAYALAGEIIVSTILSPKPLQEFEILKRMQLGLPLIQRTLTFKAWTRWVIGWDESIEDA